MTTKHYNSEEIKTIKDGFQANPSQSSQEYGQLLMQMIDDKNHLLATQVAKMPFLNDKDGINHNDARSLETFWEYIKGEEFSEDFASSEKLKVTQQIGRAHV